MFPIGCELHWLSSVLLPSSLCFACTLCFSLPKVSLASVDPQDLLASFCTILLGFLTWQLYQMSAYKEKCRQDLVTRISFQFMGRVALDSSAYVYLKAVLLAGKRDRKIHTATLDVPEDRCHGCQSACFATPAHSLTSATVGGMWGGFKGIPRMRLKA